MANEFEELVVFLRHLIDDVIARQYDYTAALLGDGNGNVNVPNREGFSYVRPDRASNKFVEILNKTVVGGDGLPIIIGRYPWQPEVRQVVSVDWASYLDVGWSDEFGGLGRHGQSHQWPDGALKGPDAFHVYTRQLFALRTEPAGSSYPLSVQVRPYGQRVGSVYKYWPSSSVLDLSGLVPATSGSSRFALVYWNPSAGGPYGALGAATGTLAVGPTAIPSRPVAPDGTIPSAYVALEGGQSALDNTHIYDAREIAGGGAITTLWEEKGGGDIYHDDGNVGIGDFSSDTVASQLHLLDPSNLTLRLETPATYNRLIEFRSAGNRRWALGADNTAETGSDDGSDFVILRYGDSPPFVLGASLTIKRDTGYVGLSQTVPAQQLDVGGKLAFSGSFENDWVDSSDEPVVFGSGGSSGDFGAEKGHLVLQARSSAARDIIFGTGNGTVVERMRILDTGEVGIGTASPGYLLDVAGQAHATSFPTSSDRRLKRKVVPLESVLSAIGEITPVSFNWNTIHANEMKRSDYNRREIGLIAQEIQAQFPELVTEWEHGRERYLAVDYGRFAAVLLKAIQELKAEIDTLKGV